MFIYLLLLVSALESLFTEVTTMYRRNHIETEFIRSRSLGIKLHNKDHER